MSLCRCTGNIFPFWHRENISTCYMFCWQNSFGSAPLSRNYCVVTLRFLASFGFFKHIIFFTFLLRHLFGSAASFGFFKHIILFTFLLRHLFGSASFGFFKQVIFFTFLLRHLFGSASFGFFKHIIFFTFLLRHIFWVCGLFSLGYLSHLPWHFLLKQQ